MPRQPISTAAAAAAAATITTTAATVAGLLLVMMWSRKGGKGKAAGGAPMAALHVHLDLRGVTLREDDVSLLRAELHPNCTLTVGPGVAQGTQLLIANFPEPEALAAAKPTLQAVLFPFAGIPPHKLQFMETELPHCSVHNLHHNAPATAEMALSLLLAAAKRILPADRLIRQNDWKAGGGPSLTITLEEEHAAQVILEGKAALILGYGAVGRRVARGCLGMGMKVRAVRRALPPPSSTPIEEEGVEMVGLGELRRWLPGTTALMLCLPGTAATEGLIGPQELALLPPDAIVVNVGRGNAVDEAALYAALREGKIHAAGLDVWWAYPTKERPRMPPSRFDFASLDNVVMSPHRGGAAGVVESETRRMQELARVVNAAVARGGTLQEALGNRVCVRKGY